MSKKFLPFLSFLLLIPSLAVNILLSQKSDYQGELVVQVVDGDSFFLKNKQTIRLFGLDAPELNSCYGQEAKQKLEELILNKKAILKEPITDDFNRIVALVYVDNILINQELIKSGFALYTAKSSSSPYDPKTAGDYARANHLGIFSADCYQPNPPNPDCPIKGNINADKQRLYFLPNCPQYNQVIVKKSFGEDYFCTQSDARKAGFTKSPTCP